MGTAPPSRVLTSWPGPSPCARLFTANQIDYVPIDEVSDRVRLFTYVIKE
jgi:hypothetical protein